jgi:signal transduction histidine kinase
VLVRLRTALVDLRSTLDAMGASDFTRDFAHLLVDTGGRIEYATPRTHEMLGVPADSLVGTQGVTTAPWLVGPGGELADGVVRGLTRTVRRPDGTYVVLRVRAALLHTPDGRPVGALCTLYDLTMVLEPTQELAEKSRLLDEARVRLSRAQHLKALGELSAEVAHEFGNVLQAIGLQAAALRRGPALPEPVMRAVWSIKQAVDIGHALTRRLLTFARDDGDRMELLDVGRVLRDLVQLVEPRINQSAHPVRMELDLSPLPEVLGNENKLTEVFLNLFLNAMDAMPEGGMLRVSAVERSGEIRIAVQDTGKGMIAEELSRAFDPFFTTKPGGTGLGLSTVYGVVRAHGGSVFAESEPGRGTTVFVSLPTAAPPDMKLARTPTLPIRETARVLVVDDHPTVREATCELLSMQGYAVEGAGTVADALEALGKRRFAVVVTDVGLPDRPGWEVARAAKEIAADTMVLLVTGWGSHLSAEEARTRGADLVFEKPVDPDVLLSTIAGRWRAGH